MLNKSKRIRLILTGLVLPLFFALIVLAFLLNKYSYVFLTTKQGQTSYLEPAQQEQPTLDIPKVEAPKVPKIKTTNSVEEKPKPTTNSTNSNWWEYPRRIYTTTKSGNNLLVLVNKKYKLPSSYKPTDLVSVKQSGIRTKGNAEYSVRQVLIADLKAMNKAAKADGVDISVISAYRSYSTQVSTYNYWVKYNGSAAAADKISARPGHSQHQLGTAIDFSSNQIGDRLGAEFNNTKASKWLVQNAWKYGFVISYPQGYESITGYAYESWHYRYIGVGNALKMNTQNQILEIFLQKHP